MARNLTVIAQVKDAASSNLDKISKGFDKTNKSVKQGSMNFTEFNRVMFGATAFIGIFSRGFQKLTATLESAAIYENVTEQFEKAFGDKGRAFAAIKSLTKNSFDEMEAMRAGIALNSLGVVKSSSQFADHIAMAATAAKRAGIDTAEGIKRFTKFYKDGQVEHLSFLNALAGTNPALQAQMAILNKAGGVMGNVMSTQQRLRLGTEAMRAASQGMGQDTENLSDVMKEMNNRFVAFRGEIGGFLGKVFSPLISKMNSFLGSATDMIRRIKELDPWLVKTIRSFALLGGALASTLAVLGTIRLAIKGLSALGIGGVPFLTISLLSLAAAFTDIEGSMDKLSNMWKGMSAMFLGVGQLVSSFLRSEDNFVRGIGKMDRKLKEFLEERGLMGLTTGFARATAVAIRFSIDVGKTLESWANTAVKSISSVIDAVGSLFSLGSNKNWSRGLIEGSNGIRGILIKLVSGGLVAFLAKKLLGPLGSIFGSSKSIVGAVASKATGGALGKRPAGTPGDPVWVALASNFVGPLMQSGRAASTGGIAGAAKAAAKNPLVSSLLIPLKSFGTAISQATGILARFRIALTPIFAVISAIGAVSGIMSGLAQTGSGFIEFFRSLGNMATSIVKAAWSLLDSVPIISQIKTHLTTFVSFLIDLPGLLINAIKSGFEKIVGWAGLFAGENAKMLNQTASAIDMQSIANNPLAQARNAARSSAEFGIGTAPTPGARPDIMSVPSMPEQHDRQIELVQGTIKRLGDLGNSQRAAALSEALKIALADNTISPDEWEMIYAKGLDRSTLGNKLVENTKEKTKPMITNTKRC